jgi:hypothetical protein
MTEVHDDPLREASHAIVGLANELAAVVMATQSLQLRLIGLKPDKDAPLTPAGPDPDHIEPDMNAHQAASRFAWEPALSDEWLTRAGPVETARTWAAALPFAEHDQTAALAMARAEARLQEIHPEAMAHYHRRRNEGMDAADAMLDTAPIFDTATAGPTAGPYGPVRPGAVVPTTPSARARPREVGLDDRPDVDLHRAPYETHASESTRYDDAELETSAPAPTGVTSRATATPPTTTHEAIVEADDAAPATGTEFGESAAQPQRVAAGEATENLAREELGQARAANAQPDVAATADVDEATVGLDEGARHTAYADSLHAAASTSPDPQATLAAETAVRNFPNAHEAIDRIPRPRALPPTSSKPKKTLGKVFRRGR